MIIVPHCGCCSKNVLYRYCAISPNIFSLQLGQFLQQLKSSRVNMFDSVSCHPPPSGIWRGNICTLSVSFSGKKSTAGYFSPLSCPCNSYLMKYEWSLWLKLLVCQVCDLNSQKLVSWYFCWTWSLYQVLDLKSLKYLDWTNVVPVECQVSVWPPLELLTDWACWTSGDSRSSLAVCHLHPRPQRAVRAGQWSRSGLTLSLRAVTYKM